jgi:hypothetical protein
MQAKPTSQIRLRLRHPRVLFLLEDISARVDRFDQVSVVGQIALRKSGEIKYDNREVDTEVFGRLRVKDGKHRHIGDTSDFDRDLLPAYRLCVAFVKTLECKYPIGGCLRIVDLDW